MVYNLKCNAPQYEQHRKYPIDAKDIAISDFQSLQSQFEAKGYSVKAYMRNKPLRGTIKVEIDGFFYYVEMFITENEDIVYKNGNLVLLKNGK